VDAVKAVNEKTGRQVVRVNISSESKTWGDNDSEWIVEFPGWLRGAADYLT